MRPGQDASAEAIINSAAAVRGDRQRRDLVTGLPQGMGISSFLVLPADIEKALKVNELLDPTCDLRPRLISSIIAAVQASLNNVSTAVTMISEAEVKHRVNLCLATIDTAYHDMQFSLRHITDILPDALIQALLQIKDATPQAALDHIEGTQRRTAWQARVPSEEPRPDPAKLSKVVEDGDLAPTEIPEAVINRPENLQ